MSNHSPSRKMIDLTEPARGSALLVGLEFPRLERWEITDSLNELAQLADTAGYDEVGRVVSRRSSPHPATYVGKGKAQEIGRQARQLGAGVVIFDDDLSSSQIRNLSGELPGRVMDRTELILDIFAQRAQTKEATLQIELARLDYLLPRLTRAWSHLNRQKGGAKGTRDAGEKQIELDRRKARERMHRLKKELVEIRKNRQTQRNRRQRHKIPVVALLGYTNAGKSTLLNLLTQAEVFVENKLFATLDPSTRSARLPSGRFVLFSDTVGFIRKLPHGLVESFRATLEEVGQADLLIEVLDASHKMIRERKNSVEKVLCELGVETKPRLVVLNKVDLINDPFLINDLRAEFSQACPISARTGEGIEDLLREVDRFVSGDKRLRRLLIPQSRADLVSYLYREGRVLKIDYSNSGVYLEVELSLRTLGPVEEFLLRE